MGKDKAIDDVRDIRHKISSEMDHNTKKILTYYKKMEKNYQDRIIHFSNIDHKKAI